MIMAGYTARIDQWNRFDIRWRKGLRKAGLDYFHAKEHWKHPFTAKVITLSDRNLLFGFVARMSEQDYKKFYREGAWGGKAQPDSMYGLCFRYCLSLVLQQALLEFPRKDFVLDFEVEEGHSNQGAPAAIVSQLKRKKIAEVSELLGTVTLGEKKKVPGLQAADGLAFGAWHGEASPDTKFLNVPPDAAVKALRPQSMTKVPIFRCHVDERELGIFKKGYFTHVDLRRRYGAAKRDA
jgi:hypothetical protein